MFVQLAAAKEVYDHGGAGTIVGFLAFFVIWSLFGGGNKNK